MIFHINVDEIEDTAAGLGRDASAVEKYLLAQAVEDGIQEAQNYQTIFSSRQGAWKPLTPRYLARKVRLGFPPQKWFLTGDTYRALISRIKITGPSNFNSGGRHLMVDKIHKTFKVSFSYRVIAPAVTGWPWRRGSRSYFVKNDRVRPILKTITPRAEARILDNMMDVVLRHITRISK